MRAGAFAELPESLARIEVVRDCALVCVSVLLYLEWIKRALLYQLSYAPTVFQSNILQSAECSCEILDSVSV
jgi:hypothetical protein